MRLVSALTQDASSVHDRGADCYYPCATDESRPLCTRCAKSGNTCEGYQDSRAFVWVGTEPFDLGQTSESSGHPSSSTTIAATSSPETLSVQPTAAAQQDVFFANVDPILLQDFIHPVLSIKLDHHAFRASIYQTHLFQHLLGHTETGGKGAHLAPISYPTDLNRFVVPPFFASKSICRRKASDLSYSPNERDSESFTLSSKYSC